jgi:hypothetical protein
MGDSEVSCGQYNVWLNNRHGEAPYKTGFCKPNIREREREREREV